MSLPPYLYHPRVSPYLRLDSHRLRLTLASALEARVESVYLHISPRRIQLFRLETRQQLQLWELEIPVEQLPDPGFCYAFEISTAGTTWWLHGAGVSQDLPSVDQFFHYRSRGVPPNWVQDQICYQLDISLFCNESGVSQQEFSRYGTSHCFWDDPASNRSDIGQGRLAALEKKLPYLDSLGVTMLYLDPKLSAPDSTSDVSFPQEDVLELQGFIKNLHGQNKRLLLDDGSSRGSCVGSAVDLSKRPYQRYFTQGVTSQGECEPLKNSDVRVLRRWLRHPLGIDGVRIQSNQESLRHELKQEKADAYLFAFQQQDDTHLLVDGCINASGFTHPVRAFFAGVDVQGQPLDLGAEEFSDWLRTMRNQQPLVQQRTQLNCLDYPGHPRFFELMDGNIPLMKAAISMLFTYVGVPCIQAGDEVGLEQWLQSFPWNSSEWNHAIFEYYRRMIHLRRRHPALRRGDQQTLYAGRYSYVYARVLQSDQVITAINRHPHRARTMQLPLWYSLCQLDRFTDVDSGGKFEVVNGSLQITIPPSSARVLVAS